MKFLQKLGKALMLPVAVLPICGILMGIGYFLCPATMQGGDIEGVRNLIGLFLVKAGGALIDIKVVPSTVFVCSMSSLSRGERKGISLMIFRNPSMPSWKLPSA